MKRWLAVGMLLPVLGGCYYYQAAEGQMQIWNRSRPIKQVIDDATTPLAVKERLELVVRVRDFASTQLDLPDNGSYRKYADLQRPYVVWNVFAASEFSIAPQEWCFPFAGCVGYRGYFNQAGAEQFAEGLRRKGLDVFVAGIPAYSTLGWFDDPVLNTMVRYPDAEIARTIFHELAHQVCYVGGDTMFNESFATAVEQEGVDRWLGQNGNATQRAAYDAYEDRKNGFIELVMKYRAELGRVYALPIPDEEKRRKKVETFAALKAEYQTIKASWGGYSGYDRFFSDDLNNAHLVPVATYSELVPGFRHLLAENGGDFHRFYEAVKKLGKLPEEKRHAILKAG
ncbi:MAG TPA: aminopeptidase [Burkholderiales bacterium]|nr:aminopeptidase [Burkholderiales bacterium]